MITLTRSDRGGCVVHDGALIAVYSGHSGSRKAEAFYLHATAGRTTEAVKAADTSGIAHKEISRALKLRREQARRTNGTIKAKVHGTRRVDA